MMLIGIDICSTRRLVHTLARSPFLREEVFSPAEIAYCEAQRHPAQHYGGRWAAKEACLKAFGFGILGYDLNQIEVVRGTSPRPTLSIGCERLRGAMRAVVGECDLQLSISHEDEYSVATVLVIPRGA